jgi:hypothetical protein
MTTASLFSWTVDPYYVHVLRKKCRAYITTRIGHIFDKLTVVQTAKNWSPLLYSVTRMHPVQTFIVFFCRQPFAHPGSSLAYSSILKMEVIRSSEISAHTRSILRHIPENGTLHSHHCENLKS